MQFTVATILALAAGAQAGYAVSSSSTTSAGYPVSTSSSKAPVYPVSTSSSKAAVYPVSSSTTSAGYPVASSNVTYTTEVVTAYTTYCPYATTATIGGKTYTVTEVRWKPSVCDFWGPNSRGGRQLALRVDCSRIGSQNSWRMSSRQKRIHAANMNIPGHHPDHH
jgi:hypothetical protein